ncbi:hypothetical protein DL89DRAFT_295317 [Linderina pennispora]|uniref:Spp2/MOS2 G-patch domain-containing protein n=1 Tax=Linderina pennispora TaxID=61395 RepID=A0A1Y1VYT4_9FUNG|nr:uncharacterized protein DL89DRAFT_295317 [Linderina pennispora]ORX66419.1 hypothetical protein DL89DRAFT_295317 [Linderina pennispora]
MRKHHTKPAQKKALGGGSKQQIGGGTGFKGFKLAASASSPLAKPAVANGAKPKGFEKLADEAPKVMQIVAAQGDTIVGEGEQKLGPLVIPVKRNANWMEHARNPAAADNEEQHGLQMMSKRRMPSVTSQATAEELVIEAKERERQAFDDDIGECADEASEDAYERVPIEEFGLAMLRGMGWT